ncbi:MAG: hypothetical protein CMH54_00930 [Myxococcales bacterium]|nr:hypothetical protein [Myxococcales bacterium]
MGDNVFDGRKDHTLDAKGRVSVPERYRNILQSQDAREIFLTQSAVRDRLCITVWSPDEWKSFLERINAIAPSHPTRQYLDDIVLSTKEVCSFDTNGRILIPQHLRQFADLDGQARFVGRGKNFEIWNPAKHEALLQSHRDNTAIDESLHLFGV